MSATTVHAGDTGVDCSFGKPPARRLIELGYRFLVGYISVAPSAPAKNITKEQCDGYIAALIRLLLVWEMTATRANLGAGYGKMDGLSAKVEAMLRGCPMDVPILVAVDTNTTKGVLGAVKALFRALTAVLTGGNIDAQEAYLRAFAAACAPYPIGIYGDVDILERCQGLWQIGWLPNAWSWSGTSRANAEAKARALGVHVLQRSGFWIDNTWAVDPNEAIADFPAWGAPAPAPAPVPPPTVGDDDMIVRLLAPTDSPARFLAECTRGGVALNCRWTGPGDDPKVAAKIEAHRVAHNREEPTIPFELPCAMADLVNVALFGTLPSVCTADQFANTVELAGPTDADPVARAGVAALNDSVARLGQEIADTKSNLLRAGT